MKGKILLKQITCTVCHGHSQDGEEPWNCYRCKDTGIETVPITPEPTEDEWSKGEE